MIRLTLSRKVFVLFFALTAMSFAVAATVYLGLQRLQDTGDRIATVKDFRFLLEGLDDFHRLPYGVESWSPPSGRKVSFEEAVERARALAREIAGEHPGTSPLLVSQLETLDSSLGYYHDAVKELLAWGRRDSELNARMSADEERILAQLAAEPARHREELHQLFAQLLVLRGSTYRKREMSGIPKMKHLAERMAALIGSASLIRDVREYVGDSEANFLNFLGIKDRDDFLHRTTSRLFQVSERTIAALSEDLARIRLSLMWQIYALISFSVALTFVLWHLTNRYFKRFLSRQHYAMRAIQAGDYDYSAERTSNDELGDLSLFLKTVATDLGESKASVNRLLASTAEAIFGLDLEGSCTFANAACVRMLGYASEADILGRRMHQLMHHTRADGTPFPEAECGACHAFRGDGETHAEHEYFWRADGTGFPVEYWSSPIERDGEAIGAVVTFFDISLRKATEQALQESRELLQSFLDNTPAVIFIKDALGRYQLVNRRFEELFQVGGADLVGKTDYELFPRETADTIRAHDREVLRLGGAREFEERIPQHNGLRHYNAIRFRLLDQDGAPRAVCGISTDVTERLHTEEALRRSQKMEAIGQLTGGIAHDFNNLLGIIIGNLELLGDELEGDAPSRRRLDSALRASLRGADLTKRLLAFSRRSVAETAPLEVNRVIKDMQDMLERALTVAIQVDMRLADHLWLTEIDADELGDALVNLAINARDAMPGGGTLTLETANLIVGESSAAEHRSLSPGEYVTITVSDTGIGITADQRERIFEPFFTTKPPGKGTGLGLSMVYGFVKRVRGDILVASEPGRGTSIRLYFPRSVAAGVAADAETKTQGDAASGCETILVVDDEPDLAMVAKSGLSRLGYLVLTAGNGQEALDLLAARPTVDLLFSDVVMPGGMDGFALAEAATRLYPKLKVLLASGFTHHTDSTEPGRFARSLVTKPYRPTELAVRIRETLDEETEA